MINKIHLLKNVILNKKPPGESCKLLPSGYYFCSVKWVKLHLW